MDNKTLNETFKEFQKTQNKVRNKSYSTKRFEEIMNECSVNKAMENCFKLGVSTTLGWIMYLIDSEFSTKDIKKLILDEIIDDTQLRCDTYGTWGDMYSKYK